LESTRGRDEKRVLTQAFILAIAVRCVIWVYHYWHWFTLVQAENVSARVCNIETDDLLTWAVMGSYHTVTGQTKSLPQYISRGWRIHVNSLDCLQL